METRPSGIDDNALATALLDGWGLVAVAIAYTPLGFGSHHWTVTDASGSQWFVTVDELGGPSESVATAFAELVAAFDTARTLGASGLDFVVAPVPALEGAIVRRLDSSFSIAVFPYVDGRAGSWGDQLEPAVRVALVERLAALHDATDRVRTIALRRAIEPIIRSMRVVERALHDTGSAWAGGPFSEPARTWLIEREPEVRELLSYATHLVEELEPRRDPLVVTHGEPHPGNVITTARGIVLIDWDTVGLAHPERDLWMFADEAGLLAHYTRMTGRALDPRAIVLHDLGWTIADLAVNLDHFRSRHRVDEDTTHAWQVLQDMSWIVSRP